MSSNELCVSEKSVAIDGSSPMPGDEIQLTDVKAKVTRVDDGKVYFAVTSANGEPTAKADDAEERPGEEPLSEESLRALAASRDEQDQASLTA